MTEAEEQMVIEFRTFLHGLGCRGDEPSDERVLALAMSMEEHMARRRRYREDRQRRICSWPWP